MSKFVNMGMPLFQAVMFKSNTSRCRPGVIGDQIAT